MAATDGVHEPVGVVVVDDVEETPSAPWHSLHQSFAEMVEGDGHLHDRVALIRVACTEQHDVVVMSEMGVGDCDGSGALDCVDESVLAVGHGEVIEPDVG